MSDYGADSFEGDSSSSSSAVSESMAAQPVEDVASASTSSSASPSTESHPKTKSATSSTTKSAASSGKGSSSHSPVKSSIPSLNTPLPIPVVGGDAAGGNNNDKKNTAPFFSKSSSESSSRSKTESSLKKLQRESKEASTSDMTSKAAPAAAAAEGGKGDWKSEVDPSSGKTYYYNVKTGETKWELESTAASTERRTTHESLQTGSTMSTASYGPVADRQRRAAAAPGEEHFQHLSNFVAFGAASTDPSAANTFPSAFGGEEPRGAAPSASSHASSPFGEDRSHHGNGNFLAAQHTQTASDAAEDPLKETIAASATDDAPRSTPTGDSKPTKSTPASSMFSTVSQHLKPVAGVVSVPIPTPLPTVAATGAADGTPFMADNQPHQSSAGPFGGTVWPPPAAELTSSSSTSDGNKNTASSPVDFKVGLPELPVSSLAPQPDLSKRRAPLTSINSGFPLFPSNTGGNDNNDDSDDEDEHGVPPLPRAREQPMDPKVVELRETSEAVERLVKAFALLRGHNGPSAPAPPSAPFEARESATLANTSLHRAGGDHTVKQIAAGSNNVHVPYGHHRAGPNVAAARSKRGISDGASADEAASRQANESLLEEQLMACVLEMLETDLGKGQSHHQLVERLKMKPPREFVGADDFKLNRTGTVSRHRDVYSVFDGEMRAFSAEDGEDANVILYRSVQDGIEKYLLSHVADAMKPPPGHHHHGAALMTASSITPQFAWILLLDLLAVCQDIVERDFVDATGAPSPVLVRYDGEKHAEGIARNAIHCLPFELVEPSLISSSSTEAHTLVFRMEYWVTRERMFTIMEALVHCIREHIVAEAITAPYKPFAGDQAGINPRVLAPSRVPMFSLIGASSSTTRVHRPDPCAASRRRSPHPLRAQKAASSHPLTDDDAALFEVDQAGTEAIAYAVSTMATDILAGSGDHKTFKNLHDPSQYADLTKALCETVCELLDDTAIKASVQRRAQEKFNALQKEKTVYVTASQHDKEKAIIAKAEREADLVVQRIMQEMLVRQAGV